MFGGAAVSAATGNLWLTVTELGGAFGLLALGDGLLVVALVLVIAGLASYPSPPRRPLALLRAQAVRAHRGAARWAAHVRASAS